MADIPTILETPLPDLFNDRALLDRTIRVLALDQGLSYPSALERFHEATASVYGSDAARGTATLRGALERIPGADADYVESAIKILDRRDQACQRAFEEAAGPRLLEQTVDDRGLVMLDTRSGIETAMGEFGAKPIPQRAPVPPGMEPLTADIGAAMASPEEFERRLARVRATGQFRGDDGREAFRLADRVHLESGRDLVATVQRNAGLASARARAGALATRLDGAIRDAADKRHEIKLLEAELDKVDARGADVSLDTARKDLRARAREAASQEPLRMLDQLETADKQIVHLVGAGKPFSPKAAAVAARIEAQKPRDADEALRLLDQDPSARDVDRTACGEVFLAGLEALKNEPYKPKLDAPEQPEIPPGVHAGSHATHMRVLERMRELDAPERDYLKVLESMIEEGRL